MANAKFIHIYIDAKPSITLKNVEEKMNLGLDWYRYTNNVFIVYTSSDLEIWQGRLLELVDPNGYMFICEFNIMNHNGWMSEDFWNWINKNR